MLPINDTAGAMKLTRSYYREWQEPEIYAKALEYNTIQIFKGLTLMKFFVGGFAGEEGSRNGRQTSGPTTAQVFNCAGCTGNAQQILEGA